MVSRILLFGWERRSFLNGDCPSYITAFGILGMNSDTLSKIPASSSIEDDTVSVMFKKKEKCGKYSYQRESENYKILPTPKYNLYLKIFKQTELARFFTGRQHT